MPIRRLSPPPVPVKEEPCDEDAPPAKPAQARGPPGFPQDVSVAELLQRLSLSAEEELLFLQLPDTLPGQPPTHDTKPIKTELHNEDGQVVVVKQEKSQVGARQSRRGGAWGHHGDVTSIPRHPLGRRRSRRRTRAAWATSLRGSWGSCSSASRGRCNWCWAR